MTHPPVDGGTGPLDDAAIVHPFVGPGGAPRSLVLTIDVITPIVDDPRAFGGIAATNALSDVYAMGGRPEVALSFAGFPSDKLPLTVLAEILAGMAEACARARCAIVGGHTIADAEPKAGLSVVGSVDPTRVWSHKTAREGQVLILTKPLGTGIVGQAIRAGKAPEALIAALDRLAGRLYGLRDAYGLRPLVLGELADGGFVLASETCALDALGARLVREVAPGGAETGAAGCRLEDHELVQEPPGRPICHECHSCSHDHTAPLRREVAPGQSG